MSWATAGGAVSATVPEADDDDDATALELTEAELAMLELAAEEADDDAVASWRTGWAYAVAADAPNARARLAAVSHDLLKMVMFLIP